MARPLHMLGENTMARPKGKMILKEFDQPLSLYTKTRELIKEDRLTLEMLAQATGVPFYWLKKFSAGEIPNPAVNRIQYLYEFLSKSKIL